MSTDANQNGTTDALLKRISDLEGRVMTANEDAKKRRHALRAEQAAHEKLKSEHTALVSKHTADTESLATDRDAWKAKAESSPTEWKVKAEELQSALRARDAKDAWAEVLGKDSLRPKVTIEKLWKDLEYTPGEAVPTPEEIAEQVKAARESVSYLFNDQVETTTPAPGGATRTAKPPLTETVAAGRGAPDKSSSRVTVRKSQLQDPKWKLDPINKEMLSDAMTRGVLDIVD